MAQGNKIFYLFLKTDDGNVAKTPEYKQPISKKQPTNEEGFFWDYKEEYRTCFPVHQLFLKDIH